MFKLRISNAKFWLLVCLCLGNTPCCFVDAGTGERQDISLNSSTVFENGKDGYRIFRIPAILKAANGDLLAFCEAREGGDASEIDLVLKRSTDLGKTWGPLLVVQESDHFRDIVPNKKIPISVGNPAPVVDLLHPTSPGRIWLPFTVENDRVFITYSDDHGKTWSKRKEITRSVKKESWGWYATGPVHSIQLQQDPHKGRLMIPCDHRIGKDGQDRGANGAHTIISDDHGKTWKLGAIDDSYKDGMNANETAVAELSDGRLYFNTRDQHGRAKGTRGETFSVDGGQTFERKKSNYPYFQPTSSVLDTPVCQASVLCIRRKNKDQKDLLLFSGPDENGPNGKGRSDLRIRFSLDNAKTWNDGPLIHKGAAAYSDLVRLSQNQIGVLFEGGKAKKGYNKILFAKFSVSDLSIKAPSKQN